MPDPQEDDLLGSPAPDRQTVPGLLSSADILRANLRPCSGMPVRLREPFSSDTLCLLGCRDVRLGRLNHIFYRRVRP
jgi:hypothetical protein